MGKYFRFLLFICSLLNVRAECNSDEILIDSTCRKCNDPLGNPAGIANCFSCSYSQTTNIITCNKCSSKYFLDSTNSCKPCATNCTTCSAPASMATAKDGKCLTCAEQNFLNTTNKYCELCSSFCLSCSEPTYNPATFVVSDWKCASCFETYVKTKNNTCWVECTKNCEVCLARPDLDGTIIKDGRCTYCSSGFFLTNINTCEPCGNGCSECADANNCNKCTNPEHFIQRPIDSGNCIAQCLSPNNIGFLKSYQKVCSTVAPKVISLHTIELNISHKSLLNLTSICDASGPDKRAVEQVGAIIVVSSSTEPDIDIKKIRDLLSQYGTFTEKGSYYYDSQKVYVEVFGTDSSDGMYSNLKVFRGISVLNYVCLNKWNVKSEIVSIEVQNNVQLTKNIRIRCFFSRNLTDTELNEMTCLIGKIIFQNSTRKSLLTNYKGNKCFENTKSLRILQDVSQEVYFDVAGDQLQDNFEKSVIDKLNEVNVAIANYSKSLAGIEMKKNANMYSYYPSEEDVYPIVTANMVFKNESNIDMLVSSNINSDFYWALAENTEIPSLNLINNISSTGKIYKAGQLNLAANTSTKISNSNLTSGKVYGFFYYARNVFDSNKSSNATKRTVNTESNFNSYLNFEGKAAKGFYQAATDNSTFNSHIIFHPSNQPILIPGLRYIPDFVSEQEEIQLINKIDSNPWIKEIHRRQQHYGYIYYHSRSDLPSIQPLTQPKDILKLEEFDFLLERLRNLYEEVPNQCLVNEYVLNHGISSHVEDHHAFGKVIVSLSLSGACYMTMRSCPGQGDPRETRVFLEKRSLLILEDQARYLWKHGISRTRILPDPTLGCTFKRGKHFRRVSLTFRRVLEEGRKKIEKEMKEYL